MQPLAADDGHSTPLRVVHLIAGPARAGAVSRSRTGLLGKGSTPRCPRVLLILLLDGIAGQWHEFRDSARLQRGSTPGERLLAVALGLLLLSGRVSALLVAAHLVEYLLQVELVAEEKLLQLTVRQEHSLQPYLGLVRVLVLVAIGEARQYGLLDELLHAYARLNDLPLSGAGGSPPRNPEQQLEELVPSQGVCRCL